MGFLSFLDAFRSKPRVKDQAIKLESPRRDRQVFQESSSRGYQGKKVISGPLTEVSGPNNASAKRRSMSRRRSWFGGKPDVDEDMPPMPTLVRADYSSHAEFKRPYLGQSRKSNGAEYSQLPSDKRDRRTSTFSNRQDVTTLGALPPLPPIPVDASRATAQATSTLPAEQRRSRRASMKSHHRSNSQASTKSRRKSRSFWASSNPDDSEEDVPPVPALVRAGTPESLNNDPFDDPHDAISRGRTRSTTENDHMQARPISACSRKSYVPKSAASGFLKSTNGASEDQRKSYRRSFKLGDNVELVCMTDEHRLEWEKLMNKNGKIEDAIFASMRRGSDEERARDQFSNAQALAALEFGTRG